MNFAYRLLAVLVLMMLVGGCERNQTDIASAESGVDNTANPDSNNGLIISDDASVNAASVQASGTGTPPTFEGGGDLSPRQHVQHLSVDERIAIQAQVRSTVAKLEAESRLEGSGGALGEPLGNHTRPEFIWPVRKAAHITDYNVDGVSNFVDHDSNYPFQTLDYNCGRRSYDTSGGYNHRGLDIFTTPFSWLKMDNNAVEVIAAAPGVITGRIDGNQDRSCRLNSSQWNAVYVRHNDGSHAWYGHLKNGSVTTKQVGDRVDAGEYLGVIGSSGNSTGPHLHLEILDASYRTIDPYAGNCNVLNADSWWEQQPDYYVTRLNHISTGSDRPYFNQCPQPAEPNEKRTFQSAEPVFLVSYYRDLTNSSVTQHRINRPDGSVYTTWNFTPQFGHFSSSYWYWRHDGITAENNTGVWRYTIDLNNTQYEHEFYVVDTCEQNRLIDAGTINDQTTIAVSQSITSVGDVTVSPGSRATLLAGDRVVLGSGFSIGDNANVTIATGDVCS